MSTREINAEPGCSAFVLPEVVHAIGCMVLARLLGIDLRAAVVVIHYDAAKGPP